MQRHLVYVSGSIVSKLLFGDIPARSGPSSFDHQVRCRAEQDARANGHIGHVSCCPTLRIEASDRVAEASTSHARCGRGSSLTLGKNGGSVVRSTVVRILVGSLVALAACSRKPSTSEAADRSSPVPAEQRRRVDFSTASLEHIAEHFASVSGRKITVEPEIARLKIGGSLKIDGVDSFLAMLPQALPVRVEIAPDRSVRILPKEPRE